MATTIITDVLAIITLFFTIWLAQRNFVVNQDKNRVYVTAALITVIILLLEIATLLLVQYASPNLVIPHRLANVLGFALSPLVPFSILSFNLDLSVGFWQRCLLRIPLYVNGLICIASYKTGWIFYVDAYNQYSRGDLFFLPTFISISYIILLILTIARNNLDYDTDDKKIIIPIFFIPLMGITLQILFPDLICLWASISVTLLLYYIFMRELQFKYDPQTGVRTRAAFERILKSYLKKGINAAVVMFDLNDLKFTNDRFGHEAGDKQIIYSAKIIQASFKDIGQIFRIGGDEFCVICRGVT
ncbi:MAG: GGDEF domain-containing protein, partial [Syntrophomonadaceae bacterium]|nr:GGDEF domain-containing protein [Syntrophomonadaceae bacterium]